MKRVGRKIEVSRTTTAQRAAVSVEVVRHMRRALKISIVAVVLLLTYIGTFTYWWQCSPVEHFTTKDGRQIRVVKFQFNKVSWHTRIIWLPAFWFMEHVCGYEKGGFAAMYDKSAMEYLKFEYVR